MSLRLLALDDDRQLLRVFSTYFGGLGWTVEACADAPGALRRVESGPAFDAVISDLHFTPDHLGEGYAIVGSARQRQPHSAVLLLTGALTDAVREEALSRGADEVIAKPAPLARLREAAVRAMKKP